MKTELEIRDQLDKTTKGVDGIYGDYEMKLSAARFYLRTWVRKYVLDEPSLRNKHLFYCLTHKATYLQSLSKSEHGLGCSKCFESVVPTVNKE